MAIIDEIQEINMDGFQVVSVDMFSHYMRNDLPMITLWNTHISFSKAAVHALNNCERVRMEVNTKTKGILLVPVSMKDKDGIKWMGTGKTPYGRKLECRAFTEALFDSWHWDKKRVYRTKGRIVTSDSKIMLFFDFSSPESWIFKSKTQVHKHE